MQFKDKLDKFKKPDVEEAIDFLKRFVADEMNGVAGDIQILRRGETNPDKEKRKELEKIKSEHSALMMLKKVVKETKYCTFKISIPTGDYDWIIGDYNPNHLKFKVRGNDLLRCILTVLNMIWDNREVLEDSTYSFAMRCPEYDEQFEGLAEEMDTTLTV